MDKEQKKIRNKRINEKIKKRVRSPILNASRFVFVAIAIILQVVLTVAVMTVMTTKYLWFAVFTDFVGLVLFLYVMAKDGATVYKLPWIVMFCLFPYAGIVVYLTFGRIPSFNRKYLKKTIKRQKADLTDIPLDANLIRYVARSYGASPYKNCYTEYLPSGEIYAERLIEEIKKAEKYIFIEFFIIEDGELWKRLFSALQEKMNDGVQVYLLYDDVGSIKKVPVGFAKKLRKQAVRTRVFRRFVPIVSALHNNRDHRKIVVIDGLTGFTGGLNLADEYVNITHPLGRWLDNGLIVKGRAVDEFVKMFVSTYNTAGSEILDEDEFFAKNCLDYKGKGFILPFGDCPYPVDTEHIGENAYLEIIYSAKKNLIITTPYFVVDTNMTEAIKSALMKGVDVKIVIPEIPDKKPVYLATKHTCELLLKYGAKIYKYKGGFIHSKTVLADGLQAVVGTVNMDYRSFTHHYECGVALYDVDTVLKIQKELGEMIERECFYCDDDDLRLNVFENVVRVLLAVFSPLM